MPKKQFLTALNLDKGTLREVPMFRGGKREFPESGEKVL